MEKVHLKIRGIEMQVPHDVVVKSVLGHLYPENKAPAIITGASMPAIGEFWEEEGGIRLGDMRMGSEKASYQLILPIGDEFDFISTWGCVGKEIDGANSVWDGLKNTQAMLSAGSELAKKISFMESCGHHDLYLPARSEARLMFINGGDEFKKEWYWTSTQSSANSAFQQGFDDGYQCGDHKDDGYRVRPVRRKI